MHESSNVALVTGIIGGLAAALHPWAASGAAFGCFFFLATSSLLKPQQRILLLIFSWGLGYASGVFWDDAGPPYSKQPMLVAAICAALASVAFTAFYHIIDKDGDVPPWLKTLLEYLPQIRRKG